MPEEGLDGFPIFGTVIVVKICMNCYVTSYICVQYVCMTLLNFTVFIIILLQH